MRHLPILILIDASSISNIKPIKVFVNRLLCGFRTEPFMLDSTYISIMSLTESSMVEVLPYTDLYSIDANYLESIGSLVSVHNDNSVPKIDASDAINLFLVNNLRTTTSDTKGDWAPTILFFGSGKEYSLNIIDYWSKRTRLLFISQDEANVSLIKKNVNSYSVKMEFSETHLSLFRNILHDVIVPHALAVGQEEPSILELNEIQNIVVEPIL